MMPSECPVEIRPMRPFRPTGPVPRDPALPTLHEALDPQALRERFRSLDPDRSDVRDVVVSYARYKPGLSCVLQYTVSDDRGERIFLGRVCTEPAFEVLAAKATAGLRSAGGGAASVHVHPDLRLILTAFPHDRAVKGLRHALDPDKLKRILHRVVDRYDPARLWVSGSNSRVSVVTYKPARRCLVRCALGIRDQATGALRGETIYARVYDDASGRCVFDVLNGLHRSRSFAAGRAPVPLPLGYDPDHRILFFDEVPGEPLPGRCDADGLATVMERAGAFLARLHAARIEAPRLLRAGSFLSEARETIERLASSGAEEAAALLDASERLRTAQPRRSAGAAVCLHGDFHPGQILVGDGALQCLDFDETGMGESAYDLGYFVAHLRKLVHLGLIDAPTEARCVGRFLTGYEAAGGSLPTGEILAWHRHLTLLRMALNSLKHLEAGWPETIRFYLERSPR